MSKMDRLIDAKLDAFVTRYPVLNAPTGGSELQLAGIAIEKEKERFDFKNFSNCKPPEFHGEMNPLTNMRWIDEIEETFMICECPERLKVIFAAHQMKGRAHEWGDVQVKAHGFEVASKFSWKTFREMFTEKFAPIAEIDKLRIEFLALQQGPRSIAEFTGS
ncbi:uncharacterized protein [Rutidosis leptorrhynchoides]|uniref:uncharacterized protein n=1 Tax=Rutidosis leptorrhynchoides TaxID=125765 RepID=UPI003A99C40B